MDWNGWKQWGLAFAAGAMLSACTPSRQVFTVQGTVIEIFPERNRVRIAHDAIPGYMAAMTMGFDLKSTNELAGIRENDRVRFKLIVTADDGWIEQIQKTGEAPPKPAGAPAPETTRIVKDVPELGVGDLLPSYTFTNQLGQAVKTDDFRGRALAFTFIFTRCPFPVYCPRMSTNFAQAAQALVRLPNAPTNWHLLTLSFDPKYDTPNILKAYAERHQYDPRHWTFATGSLMEISAVGDHFGLLFWLPDLNQPGNISHNMRTIVLDTEGRVSKVFTDEKWTPEELVDALLQAAKKSERAMKE